MKKIDWTAVANARKNLDVPSLRVNQEEEDQIKYLSYEFPKKFPQVEIIHLTDLQIGSKKFLKAKFLNYRQWILAEPYRFAVLGGDVVDAATLLSIGSPYDNEGEPIEQVDVATELLQPLADAGRILGYVGGNHERRTIKTGDLHRDIPK